MTPEGPVVVGFDGTQRAASALSWAADVASASGLRLVVVRSYHVGDFSGGPETAASASLGQLKEALSAVDFGSIADERVQPKVVSGNAGPALVEMASAEKAALLVLGAPHVGAIAPHGLGSTMQHVTSHSLAPVAIVRHPGGSPTTAPLVVGLDPVDCNMKAIDWSLGVAGLLDVPLEVVTVSSHMQAVNAVEHILEDLICRTSPVVDLFQSDGDPADELMRRATEIDALAIVVGQKRRHNLGGRILGHIPSKLIYQSQVPVILLPHT